MRSSLKGRIDNQIMRVEGLISLASMLCKNLSMAFQTNYYNLPGSQGTIFLFCKNSPLGLVVPLGRRAQ